MRYESLFTPTRSAGFNASVCAYDVSDANARARTHDSVLGGFRVRLARRTSRRVAEGRTKGKAEREKI